ncbi:MAG: MoaD/ThiS family protein [Chloroflexi bacterium]|nr:MoaD/ThiS family protein [Chloroflexota bacterium]
MVINVHLHTILELRDENKRINQLKIELPEGSSINFLLSYLNISINVDSLLFAVNGRVASIEHILKDGDEVNIMPAISGGSIHWVNY